MTKEQLMFRFERITLGMLVLFSLASGAIAQDRKQKRSGQESINYPIAILPFRERGEEVKGMGGQASDLLFAGLATDPDLWLVDREEIDKTLAEQELNLSGVVNPDEAVRIGQITGARILVTGSVFQVGTSLYVVAKVIGTETTRVQGASSKGPVSDGVDALMPQLSDEVAKVI